MGWNGVKVWVGVVPSSAEPRIGQGYGVSGPVTKCSSEKEGEPCWGSLQLSRLDICVLRQGSQISGGEERMCSGPYIICNLYTQMCMHHILLFFWACRQWINVVPTSLSLHSGQPQWIHVGQWWFTLLLQQEAFLTRNSHSSWRRGARRHGESPLPSCSAPPATPLCFILYTRKPVKSHMMPERFPLHSLLLKMSFTI